MVAYNQRFGIQTLSEDMQKHIYEEIIRVKSTFQEQKDLEKFERIHDGKPKDDTEFANSINFLAQLLNRYHKAPVYILVDEYDNLINTYFDSEDVLDKLTKTFSGIFTAFAKPNGSMNDHLKAVIFTGILRVAKANIFSGLNNLEECTVFDDTFSMYYGFTRKEVQTLLQGAGKAERFSEVEAWYNGYKIGETIIYNPWSVMQFIKKNVFRAYWVNTAKPGLIRDIILNNKGHVINGLLRTIIQNGVQKSINIQANANISVEDLKKPMSIWSFLLHTGYLTMDTSQYRSSSGLFECSVRIPNVEIAKIYDLVISEWIRENAAITGAIFNIFEKDYESLADNLQRMLENKYNSALFAMEESSVEEVYHSLLLGELNKDITMADYALLPEKCTGQGRADILFVDNKNKIIVPIELKRAYSMKNLEDSAIDAVNQAIHKKYGDDAQYKNYDHHPAIGISFLGTHLAIRVAGSDKIIQRVENR
jgi:hypothetical protein